MRAYTVTHSGIPQKDGDTKPFLKYAGSQSQAADAKRELWDANRDNGIKRSDIEVTEIEIPTHKAGLIDWLNENAI